MSHVLRLTPDEFARLQGRARAGAENKKNISGAPKAPAEKTDWPIALRDQIRAAGLPVPVREYTFHDTRNWRFDLAWPDRMLAVEVDGGVHRLKSRFLADREKLNQACLLRWRYLRVGPEQVRDGEALALVRVLLELPVVA